MFWTLNDNGYDPFGSVRNLQREMNRLFSRYDDRDDAFPAVNIWSSEDQVMVTAELPGMNPDDIDISVVQGQLTISGQRKIDLPENMNCHRQERSQGNFTRAFRLPFDVNNEKVTAKYRDGILYISLPRLEETKPKKITVNVK